jgi:hypothetical protein
MRAFVFKLDTGAILQMQRLIGILAVQRLIIRRSAQTGAQAAVVKNLDEEGAAGMRARPQTGKVLRWRRGADRGVIHQ